MTVSSERQDVLKKKKKKKKMSVGWPLRCIRSTIAPCRRSASTATRSSVSRTLRWCTTSDFVFNDFWSDDELFAEFDTSNAHEQSCVVALHCSLGSGRQWAPLAAALGHRHRVLAPDISGNGDGALPAHAAATLASEVEFLHSRLQRCRARCTSSATPMVAPSRSASPPRRDLPPACAA